MAKKSTLRTEKLGDESGLHVSPCGVHELRKLWNLVFGLHEDDSSDQELQPVYHRTSGVLYYFELLPGKSAPRVKVYLPVRHYGKNDLYVAEKLQEYLGTLGRAGLAIDYIEALKNIV
jgi:DMATS type aromatic prenyltransferase